LVLVDGEVQELPLSDTLPVVPSGVAIQAVTVNVPYTSKDEARVIVAVPGMTANSRIICDLAATTEDDENELDDLSDLSVRANPTLDSLEFLFACPGAFGGPVKVQYLVGA
jgi:hypothetical protein